MSRTCCSGAPVATRLFYSVWTWRRSSRLMNNKFGGVADSNGAAGDWGQFCGPLSLLFGGRYARRDLLACCHQWQDEMSQVATLDGPLSWIPNWGALMASSSSVKPRCFHCACGLLWWSSCGPLGIIEFKLIFTSALGRFSAVLIIRNKLRISEPILCIR